MKLAAALMACSLLAGCSAPAPSDDGQPGAGQPAPTAPATNPGAGSTPPPPVGDGAAPAPSADASPIDPPTSTDAGAPNDAAKPPLAGSAFTGAPPYTATLGPSTLIKRHVFSGDNPAGQPCLSCHTGDKGIPQWLFAGTVYADAAGTKPAASVEVRVRDSAGQAHSAYTDANGNFFFPQGALPPLAAPATAGVRNATTTHVMTNAINDGNCNSCHHEGGAGRLQLL